MSLYRTLSQMPADLPLTLGRRLPRAYERTAGTMLGRDAFAAFERTDFTVQATVTEPSGPNNGASRSHAVPFAGGDAAVSAPPTASAPSGGSRAAESRSPEARADAVALPDGWIEWRGGKCPVPDGVVVNYRMRVGAVSTDPAERLTWQRDGFDWDIVAYRIAEDA